MNSDLIKYLMVFVSFVTLIIFLSGCDKEVYKTPVEPEPSKGKIILSTSPEHFLIFVNGRNSGRFTPDSLTFLDDGIYDLTLRRKYFNDTTITVSISNEESKEIFINYHENPGMFGSLALSSNPPGGSIVLNDSVLNRTTPDTILGLLPGEYRVKISLLNYREMVIDVIIESGNLTQHLTVLRDTTTWIDYQINNSAIQSNSLTDIKIDDSNVKWIGSSDKGLMRFDDISFNYFSTANSAIPGNTINCISIAPNNDVWVGTNAGIGVFNGSSWTILNRQNSGLTSDLINSIEFDQNGVAWIGVSTGLFKFDGINWTQYNDDAWRLWVLDTHVVNDLIWIGTFNHGIMSLQNENITYYPDSVYNYPSKKITSINSDISGNVWFTHSPDSTLRNGVSYFNGHTFVNYTPGIPNIAFNSVTIDQFNNKWVSSFDGLWHYNSNNIPFQYTTINSLISSNRCTAEAIDIFGNVWITTSGGGLNKLKIIQ
ncbi:MAG: PEGA domain-containing protein [Ignavibacterium sp.]|nr:PEGA domain-containing protein [Ignavibacterium sp.]